MVRMDMRRVAVLGLAVMGVLATLTVLTPLINTARRLCPVRPDGVSEAGAVPAYSRKYGVGCATCHTVYPVLNDVGRKFKESGYVMDRDSENKEGKLIPAQFPWAAVVKSGFDTKRSVKPELRGINDIGMFFSDGAIAKNFSYWAELHMRANDPGTAPQGFAFAFERARVGWHYNKYLNVLAGFGNVAEGVDTYETLRSPNHSIRDNGASDIIDHQKQGDSTLEPAPFDQQYAAIQGSLDKEGIGALKYWTALGAGWQPSNKGVDGAVDPALGQGPMNVHMRVVADTLRGLALGAYYNFGHNDYKSTSLSGGVTSAPANARFVDNTATYAFDTVIEALGFTNRAAYFNQKVHAEDPNAVNSVNPMSREAAYVESFYSIKKDNMPWLAPMVRYEWMADHTTPGSQTWKDYLVLAMSYLPAENVKLTLEFWDNTKNRKGGKDQFHDNALQGSVAVGF